MPRISMTLAGTSEAQEAIVVFVASMWSIETIDDGHYEINTDFGHDPDAFVEAPDGAGDVAVHLAGDTGDVLSIGNLITARIYCGHRTHSEIDLVTLASLFVAHPERELVYGSPE